MGGTQASLEQVTGMVRARCGHDMVGQGATWGCPEAGVSAVGRRGGVVGRRANAVQEVRDCGRGDELARGWG